MLSWPFCVAQISNLLYRRFPIGKATDAGGAWRFGSASVRWWRQQVKNLRYSRLKICATVPLLALWLLISGVSEALAQPASGPAPSAPQARILLVTGLDHPGHLWRQTAPALAQALRQDPRLEVATLEDPYFLDSAAIRHYDLVLLHFQNWERPGPGPAARENLRRFVAEGKGLALVHFACGAWHGEWPEFEQIAGRVWFGANPGSGKRQHDPYGPFRVEMVNPGHTITRGLSDFDTQDELYTCLTGDHPIEIIAQAKSKLDGNYYPMAFISRYGLGRTFHCILGHDAKALSLPAVQELYRRGCAWAAGLSPTAANSHP